MWPFDKTDNTKIRADTANWVRNLQLGEEVRADPELYPDISADLLRAFIEQGTDMSREKALQIPALNTAIRLLADIVSSIPFKLYRKNEEGKSEEVKDDPRVRLFNQDTGDTLTTTQFWRAMIEDYFLGEGGYAYINRDYWGITSINYVECESISVIKDPDPIFKDYSIYCWGKRYEPWEFFKILRKSRDGAIGVPIWKESSEQLLAAYYDTKWRTANAKKGGLTKGFLSSERNLSDDQVNSLKEAWRNLFESKAENMMVLNKGLSYQSAQHSAREMMQEENREEDLKEISMLLGVPGPILTGSATAQDYEILIKHGITPLLADIEASADKDLLTTQEQENDYFWAFDTKELTRGDIKGRYEAYQIAISNNWMQPDEVRQLEDLEPLGLNFIKLGLDSVLYDPKTGVLLTPNTGQTQKLEEGRLTDESGIESGRIASDGLRERTRQDEQTGDDSQRTSD